MATTTTDGKQQQKPRRRRGLLLTLSALLVAAASAAAYVLTANPVQSNLAPIPAQAPVVVGLGYLEPASSIIKVGAPGTPDALRIGELRVAEGNEVEAGQVLATLDTIDKLRAQVEASETMVALKRLMLERQKHEIALSIASKRAAVERARAELEAAKSELERQSTLVDRSIATPANLEKRKKEHLTAQASLREMEASLRRVEAVTQTQPPISIDIAVAAQELANAEADLRVQRASLDQATIRAPFKGRVLALKTRAGERFGNDGLLELGTTDRMRAVVEVYQSDVGRVRIGQSVELRADALPAPVRGTVERIGATIKRQSVINNDPATATDGRVIDVFVALDPDASKVVSSLSRLQVTGVFGR